MGRRIRRRNADQPEPASETPMADRDALGTPPPCRLRIGRRYCTLAKSNSGRRRRVWWHIVECETCRVNHHRLQNTWRGRIGGAACMEAQAITAAERGAEVVRVG